MKSLFLLVVLFCTACTGAIDFPMKVTKKEMSQTAAGNKICRLTVYDGRGEGEDETSWDEKYCAYELWQEIK